ncbi:DUF6174 domain-containing protein [Catenovulum sp. 2E275]|uniref:DUF6174 domain-containing protein n=1 Tax=Catenovulum sp. 2E275 TaxID=2980497 RepID=UPI0021D0C5C2|nr:DUF6174 domain-containing protein [Catenovulum sp. 2E275]MCU4675964.1 DUF6174 domain-containing protein [Catenovulum sp. 2E275]
MNTRTILISIVFMLFGCDENSDTHELVNLIQDNENTWQSSGINSYTYVYSDIPTDCPNVDPYPPVEITVEEGVITTLYVPELDTFLEAENHSYPTINMIFENMMNSANDIKGIPTFDDTFGYPTSYEVDLTSSQCDGQVIMLSFI